ncbi:PREDICTED: uncharacterized protein LOC106805207 [Priapulus caudatus]|uniref:Uncharacterized protein LOC106805207 n=1 Tax=Priapulus caudatus TaxID=37621 RepID=A0ABM1DQH0_PRICU|nr:PREDICTED: uncharacterized protein LOC106805207 [Priapulus caudatus]
MNRVMFNMNRVSHRVVISVVLVIFCEITGLESGSTVGAVNLPPVFWNSSNPVCCTTNSFSMEITSKTLQEIPWASSALRPSGGGTGRRAPDAGITVRSLITIREPSSAPLEVCS